MKLVLDLAPVWEGVPPDGEDVVAKHTRLPIRITIRPVDMTPPSPNRFFTNHLGVGIPEGATVSRVSDTDVKTEKGWEIQLIEAKLVAGEREVGCRLGAFYKLYRHMGVVIVDADSVTSMDGAREDILQLLTSGRPDWSGLPPVSLEELLS